MSLEELAFIFNEKTSIFMHFSGQEAPRNSHSEADDP